MVDDLKALEEKVGKGFDWCYSREVVGKTDEFYETHYARWEQMLADYQYRLTHLGLTRA